MTEVSMNHEASSYQVVQEATAENPWAIGVIGALPTSLAEPPALSLSSSLSSSSSPAAAAPAASTLASVTCRALQCVRDGPWCALLVLQEKDEQQQHHQHHQQHHQHPHVASSDKTPSFLVYVFYTNASQSMMQQKFETPVTTVPVPAGVTYNTTTTTTTTTEVLPPLIALQQVSTNLLPQTFTRPFNTTPTTTAAAAPPAATVTATSTTVASPTAFLYILPWQETDSSSCMLYGYKITAAHGGATGLATSGALMGVHLPTSHGRQVWYPSHQVPPMLTSLPLRAADTVSTMVTAASTNHHHHNNNNNTVYVGTTQGRIFRIQPRPATNSLHCQDLTADMEQVVAASSNRGGGGGGGGLFALFASPSSAAAAKRSATASLYSFQSVTHLLPAPCNPSAFWTVSAERTLHYWQAVSSSSSTSNNNRNTHNTAPRIQFTVSAPLDYRDYIPTFFHTQGGVKIQAVAQATPDILHVLMTAPETDSLTESGSRAMDTTSTTNNDDTNRRWYAVRWQLTNENDGDGSHTSWKLVRVTWLNRLASSASCLGWQAAQNGMAMGAFLPHQSTHLAQSNSIILAVVPTFNDGNDNMDTRRDNEDPVWSDLSPSADDVYEYDCDPEDTLLPGSFQADHATHGVTYGSRSGVWIRAECKVATAMTTTTTTASATADTAASTTYVTTPGQRGVEAQLLSHLKATFQHFYRSSGASSSLIQLPPSWNMPEAGQLRDIVVGRLGLEHLPQNMAMGNDGGYALHRAYIEFLQQIGLYRSLKPLTKWQLLAIGQEIDAFDALPTEAIPERFLPQKTGLARWIETYQEKVVLASDSGTTMQQFTTILATVLGAAVRFRAERASYPYDLAAMPLVRNREAVPLWISRPALQQALFRWVTYQHKLYMSAPSRWQWTNDIETILLAALESFAATFAAMPDDDAVRTEYAQIQAMVIPLMYALESTHELAWSLSQEHLYFAGCCELAKMHEKLDDSPFQLEPLFKTLGTKRDIETQLSFGAFCLKWHVDRKFIGHALNYGKFCPMDLHALIEKDPDFGRFRWVVAIRNGDYESATNSLMKNTTDTSQSPAVSIGDAKFNMAVAEISNSLRSQDTSSQYCSIAIEKLRERAIAQERLLGETEEARSKPLWPADKLLKYALVQLDLQETLESKIDRCILALAVCTTFASMDDGREGAVRVWSEALNSDLAFLKQFVFKATEMDLEAVYDRTIIGGLYREVAQEPSLKEVHLDSRVGELVLALLEPDDRAAVSRLMRSLSQQME